MEFKHNSVVFALIICLCGIATCFAQDGQGDFIIVTDFSPPAIYYATFERPMKFKQIPVDGGRRNITAPAAVDYDPVEQRIYWTQWSSKWNGEGNICRCDLQGRFYQVLIKELDYANGLAIDSKARKMYFSHEGMSLERANLDGSGRISIIRELPTSGHFVYFDAIGKRIYWADQTKRTIESSKLNGSNRTLLINELEGLDSHPSDMFVDIKTRRLYWSDFGTDRISSSNMTGGDRKVLYQYPLVSTETHPNAIAVTLQNEIYWIDRNYPKLRKMPKNVREGQAIVPKDIGNKEFGWPSGLHIHQVGAGNTLKSSSIVLYFGLPLIFQLLLKL